MKNSWVFAQAVLDALKECNVPVLQDEAETNIETMETVDAYFDLNVTDTTKEIAYVYYSVPSAVLNSYYVVENIPDFLKLAGQYTDGEGRQVYKGMDIVIAAIEANKGLIGQDKDDEVFAKFTLLSMFIGDYLLSPDYCATIGGDVALTSSIVKLCSVLQEK